MTLITLMSEHHLLVNQDDTELIENPGEEDLNPGAGDDLGEDSGDDGEVIPDEEPAPGPETEPEEKTGPEETT